MANKASILLMMIVFTILFISSAEADLTMGTMATPSSKKNLLAARSKESPSMIIGDFPPGNDAYKLDPAERSCSKNFKYENVVDIPPSVDWREKGAVTPVKAQKCGDCWAFSVVAAMEGVVQITTGNLMALSEQQLSDCDKKDNACKGGIIDDGFKFVAENNGLNTESDYAYHVTNDTCDKEKEPNNAPEM